MAGVRRDVFTCVGWQVTLCYPIWQVTSRSSEVGFPRKSYIGFFTFNVLVFVDISLRHSELVQQLRDHVQDTLLDHLITQGSGPTLANRRICDLLLLMPLLTHKKILAKEFWLGVKHGGRVTLHKLLSEMLEFLTA